MTEQTKSLIRHIITAIGLLLAALGANKWTGLLDIITNNLDGVFAAIAVFSGLVTAIFGFFKDRNRHVERVEGAKVLPKNP